MRIYSIQRQTLLHATRESVWKYFSDTGNLNELTPSDMSFEVLDASPENKMYAGMIINYRIRPVLNIPVRWTTEITHCLKGNYFVDEQRFGPYSFWHHQHSFEDHPDGILMRDIVHYALPFGIVGRFIHMIYVKRRLASIFDFREKKIKDVFPGN